MIEMSPPPCGILTGAVAAGLSPVEHRLDPATHSAGRLRLRGPDWFEHPQDKSCINGSDREVPNPRIDVGVEGRWPLRPMFRPAPAGLVRSDQLFGAGTDRNAAGLSEPLCGAGGISHLDRVRSFKSLPARLRGQL